MSSNKESAALIGVGTVACAVCCAGPILGFLAAIGLGTVIGVATFGSIALVLGAVANLVVMRRRRGRFKSTVRRQTETHVPLIRDRARRDAGGCRPAAPPLGERLLGPGSMVEAREHDRRGR
jgi:hypothetical protein